MSTTTDVVVAAASFSRIGFITETLIVSGLIAVQVILAFYMFFLHRVLSLGVNSLSLVIFGGLASSLLLLPFAVVLEKKKWPSKLRPMVIFQMLLGAITGTAFLVLATYGIKMTSPAVASSMPNLGPVIIFVIAACMRFEKFSIWCKYSRAKVIGTVLCLSGAMAMSFLISPTTPLHASSNSKKNLLEAISKEWILGFFCLLLATVLFSCGTILQAVVMVNFHAPLTLCVISSFVGTILTAMLQFVTQGDFDVGSSSLSLKAILGLVILGAVVTSVCVGFQTWCLKKKGPVLVSIFSPIQTVFSTILSAFVLGQVISKGCLAGMLLMFVGLYIVLWAKKKEDCDVVDVGYIESDHDLEKPLLF